LTGASSHHPRSICARCEPFPSPLPLLLEPVFCSSFSLQSAGLLLLHHHTAPKALSSLNPRHHPVSIRNTNSNTIDWPFCGERPSFCTASSNAFRHSLQLVPLSTERRTHETKEPQATARRLGRRFSSTSARLHNDLSCYLDLDLVARDQVYSVIVTFVSTIQSQHQSETIQHL